MVNYPIVKSKSRSIARSKKNYKRTKKTKSSALSRRISKLEKLSIGETKQITAGYDTYFNSGISSTSEFYSLIPALSQSVNDYGRVGNKISARYINLKGLLSYELASLQTNNFPIFAEVFIFSDKIQRSQNTAAHDYKLLNLSGSSVAYDGTQFYATLPFNTDEFQLIKRKKYRLAYNWAPGSSSTTFTEITAPLQRWVELSINMKDMLLDYESQTATLPDNHNIWMAVGFCQYTNTTQSVAPLRFQWSSTMYYRDA